MHHPPAALAPELVPEPLWGLSACRLLPRGDWRRLRALTLADAGNRCAVCGTGQEQRMVCHERWRYDDDASVATLTGFAILCPACNLVHHMGRARQLGLAEEALTHMAEVNAMTALEASALTRQAFEQWERRSRQQWTVAVEPALRCQHPGLERLDGLSPASRWPSAHPEDRSP